MDNVQSKFTNLTAPRKRGRFWSGLKNLVQPSGQSSGPLDLNQFVKLPTIQHEFAAAPSRTNNIIIGAFIFIALLLLGNMAKNKKRQLA